MKHLIIILGASLVLASCTKKREFKTVLKPETLSTKANISTEDIYLYVPSVNESPRAVTATRPHWMGGEKLVKFTFTEKALKVLELEKDGRLLAIR